MSGERFMDVGESLFYTNQFSEVKCIVKGKFSRFILF